MNQEASQNSKPVVTPPINNIQSSVVYAPKSRKLSRSRKTPKEDFILDGVRVAVADHNTTFLKTRVEKVNQYRLNNSIDITKNNMCHRPRKKKIRDVSGAKGGSVSFYVGREDDKTINKFITKMREKEDQLSRNIQKLVEGEFESLNEDSARRYKRIFKEVNKRILPEKEGIKYADYLDPETLTKLELALQEKEKTTPEKNEAFPYDFTNEFSQYSLKGQQHSFDHPPMRNSANPRKSTNKKIRTRSVIEPEDIMRAREMHKVYRIPDSEFQALRVKHIPWKRPKSRMIIQGDEAVKMPRNFNKRSLSVANTPMDTSQIITANVDNAKKQEDVNALKAHYIPRTYFMAKTTSHFRKADGQKYPIENEGYSSHNNTVGQDPYQALLKVQEKIDTSYLLLREKIIKSRDEANRTSHRKSVDEERPNTVANLSFINVKDLNNNSFAGKEGNVRRRSPFRVMEKRLFPENNSNHKEEPTKKEIGLEPSFDQTVLLEQLSDRKKKMKRIEFINVASRDMTQVNNLSVDFGESRKSKKKEPPRKKFLELTQNTEGLMTPGIERRMIHENLQLDNSSMGFSSPATDWMASNGREEDDEPSPGPSPTQQEKEVKKQPLVAAILTNGFDKVFKGTNGPSRKVSFSESVKIESSEDLNRPISVNSRERKSSAGKRNR